MNELPVPISRRPLRSRHQPWARGLAARLVRLGLAPNQVSLLSVAFAIAAGAALLLSMPAEGAMRVVMLLLAAAGIQLRLVCNLMDGLMAVEGGLQTAAGDLFNDFPDRLADLAILVPAGYAASAVSGFPELGWLAGAMAVLTAYVRVLGASCGVGHDFRGPMAKPHRMAVMTAACVFAALEDLLWPTGSAFTAALLLVIVGCGVTMARRLCGLVATLEAKQTKGGHTHE